MIPNCGFPLRLVEQYDSRQGVWRSRRGSGQTIAAGRYRFGGKSFAEVQLSVPQDAPKEVYLTAHLCERALHLVLKRFEERDILTQLLGHFSGGEVTASFMRGHDLLADCAADGQSLRLDSDTSERRRYASSTANTSADGAQRIGSGPYVRNRLGGNRSSSL